MNWISTGPKIEDLTNKLTSNHDMELVDVLDDDAFAPTLRSASPILVDYLTTPKRVNELCDWLFTTIYRSHPRAIKIEKNVLAILTSSSMKIQSQLKEHGILSQRLMSFTSSEYSRDPKSCGFFAAVVHEWVKFTKGNFLKEFPNIVSELINNIEMLSIRDLFVTLVVFYTEAMNVSLEMMTNFISACKEEHADAVTDCIKNILMPKEQGTTIVSKRKDAEELCAYFDSPEIFRMLLDIGTRDSSNLARYKALNLARFINKYSKHDNTYMLNEFRPIFLDTMCNEITCATVAGMQLFKEAPYSVLEHMFTTPPSTHLNNAIYEIFKNMTNDVLTKTIEDMNLESKFIALWESHYICNAQLTDILLLLNIDNPKWNAFKVHAKAVKEMRNQKYGQTPAQRKTELARQRGQSDSDSEEEEFDDESPTGKIVYSISLAPSVYPAPKPASAQKEPPKHAMKVPIKSTQYRNRSRAAPVETKKSNDTDDDKLYDTNGEAPAPTPTPAPPPPKPTDPTTAAEPVKKESRNAGRGRVKKNNVPARTNSTEQMSKMLTSSQPTHSSRKITPPPKEEDDVDYDC